MDFRLTDEQTMLRDASRRLLQDRSASTDVRSLLDHDDDVEATLWQLAGELGWVGLALPGEHGGAEQGMVELSVVAEEIGRAVARGPFLPSALVGRAVARGGGERLQAQVLAALAEGGACAAWAFRSPGRAWTAEAVTATATREGDQVRLDGSSTSVQDAGAARWLLVTALLDGAPTSFVVDVDAPGLSCRRQRTLDLTRNFYVVTLDAVRVDAERTLSGGTAAVQQALDEAIVLGCAQSLGVAERLTAMTVDYAKVRKQFGRAIGSFQAIKHKCADMTMLLLGARAATYYAAMAADAQTPDASRAASTAKAFVSEATSRIAGEALQIHGGIGFTWEHDLHLYLRRAKAEEVLHGDIATHRERLCSLLVAGRSAAAG